MEFSSMSVQDTLDKAIQRIEQLMAQAETLRLGSPQLDFTQKGAPPILPEATQKKIKEIEKSIVKIKVEAMKDIRASTLMLNETDRAAINSRARSVLGMPQENERGNIISDFRKSMEAGKEEHVKDNKPPEKFKSKFMDKDER